MVQVTTDSQTPAAAKVLDEFESSEINIAAEVRPKPVGQRKQRKAVINVVEPPQFYPVRATTSDEGFLYRLKIREFVLKCN